MRILIADDHPIVRHGLKQMLASDPAATVVGEATNGDEALELARKVEWDMAIFDFSMPGRSGLDLLGDIKKEFPGKPVLILSMHSEDVHGSRVLRAGGAGYITKDSAPQELTTAVRKVANGGKYVSASLAEILASECSSDPQKALHEKLSDREYRVMWLDVRMPGMDGFETARMIRGRERSRLTPIIFLTAAADEMSSMFRGYEAGAVDYLPKPVVPEILKAKVAVFVELFRKSERLHESEDKLRRLAAHLISVREEERAHIAREIHDELGQVLTGPKVEVTWLAKRLKEKPLVEKTDSMRKLIDTTVQTVRKLASVLRPDMLVELGLD